MTAYNSEATSLNTPSVKSRQSYAFATKDGRYPKDSPLTIPSLSILQAYLYALNGKHPHIYRAKMYAWNGKHPNGRVVVGQINCVLI